MSPWDIFLNPTACFVVGVFLGWAMAFSGIKHGTEMASGVSTQRDLSPSPPEPERPPFPTYAPAMLQDEGR